MLRLSRRLSPQTARSTTSSPFRQQPNPAPATQTHTQMQKILRLPQVLRLSRRLSPRAARSKTSVPLDSYQMLPLPRKHTARCPRNLQAISKVLRLSRRLRPGAARSTTSSPFRHLPNAAPATQTHTQMQKILRLPRNLQAISKVLRLSRRFSPRAARSTTSSPFRHLPNAAPATQTHTQMQKILRLPRNLCAISKVLRLSRRLSRSKTSVRLVSQMLPL